MVELSDLANSMTIASVAHGEAASSPRQIPVSAPFKSKPQLRESLPAYFHMPEEKKAYKYRAEDDLEGESSATCSRSRCMSIGPALTRDPIAPGIYTRVRKRSLTPLDEVPVLIAEPGTPRPCATHHLSPLPLLGSPPACTSPAAAPSMPATKAILPSKVYEEDLPSGKSSGLPIIQEFILDSQFRITIEGRKLNRLKTCLYYVLCIVSGGIVFLLCKWFPGVRSKLITSQSALAHSSHIYVRNSYGQAELVSVRRSYYGKLLTAIFGSQRLHECLVVDQKDDAYSGPEALSPLSAIAEEDSSSMLNEETLMYTHNASPVMLQSTSAEHVSVEDSSSFSPSLLEKKQGSKPSPADFLYFFEYRCIRFIYHPNLGRYFESSQWESLQSTNYSKLAEGITDATATQRSIIYGENAINIQKKSIFRLLIDEVLHPFNVFQIFSVILWCNDTYYFYAGAIFLISSYTIALTVYETRKNLANLVKMSHFCCELRIFRDNKWSLQPSTALVPGDIFEPDLATTSTMPCDALLLEGDCIMNESMLTGESLSVSKCPLNEELWDAKTEGETSSERGLHPHVLALSSEKSILFAGTKLVRVRGVQDQPARAVAIRTGFNTTKGHLIRNILFQRPINFKFYRDALRFIYILAAIAAAGFSLTLYSFISRSVDLSVVFLRALDLITIVVPPALPASMAIGVTFAMSRLKRKNIYCISPPRINVCGKLNLLCFDKTGTLTEEGLDLFGVHILDADSGTIGSMLDSMPLILSQIERQNAIARESNEQTKPSDALVPMAQLLAIGMATCHSVKSINGALIGDPLDVKMFQFTGWKLEDTGYSSEGSLTILVKPRLPPASLSDVSLPDKSLDLPELGVIRCFEFVTELRRMSVLVKAYQGFGMSAFVKGAPESIRDICMAQSLPSNFDLVLNDYTSKGYRVIALATKPFPTLNWARAQKLRREEVESDLAFVGFIMFENRLKPATKDVIHALTGAKLRAVISTGDNILTAMSVAKDCKIAPACAAVFLPRLLSPDLTESGAKSIVWECVNQPCERLCPFTLRPLSPKIADYTMGCTGHMLEYLIDHCSTDVLFNVLIKCNVYARMSPDQKQRLVECFQKLEYCVGFCGDGANDCGALKAADVGLSLSEAEASIAAPFTSKVTDIRCTIDLVLEGRSALVTSFSCFKFMALYSLIQFTSVSLLYYYITNLSDGQYIYIDLCIIIPLAICFGRLKSNPHITAKRPTANLVSKKVLCSIIGQTVMQIAFQVVVFFTAISRTWYQELQQTTFEGHTPSQINTIMFSFTTFQYLIVAFIFTSNQPFQKSILTNPLFMACAIAILVLNLTFLVFPPSWLMDLMNMANGIPTSFRMFLLALALANCIASYLSEICIYNLLHAFMRRRKKKSKKRVKLFKKLLASQSSAPFDEPEKAV